MKEPREASEVQQGAEVKSLLFLAFSQGPRAVQQKLGSWPHPGLEETSRRQLPELSQGPERLCIACAHLWRNHIPPGGSSSGGRISG